MAMFLTILVAFIIFLVILFFFLGKFIDYVSLQITKNQIVKMAKQDREKAKLGLQRMASEIDRLNEMLEEAHEKNENETRIKEIKKAIKEVNGVYSKIQKDLEL